jgi:hypothetical protein
MIANLGPPNRARLDPNPNCTTSPSIDTLETMSKSENDSKKAAAVEDDDEPDEW